MPVCRCFPSPSPFRASPDAKGAVDAATPPVRQRESRHGQFHEHRRIFALADDSPADRHTPIWHFLPLVEVYAYDRSPKRTLMVQLEMFTRWTYCEFVTTRPTSGSAPHALFVIWTGESNIKVVGTIQRPSPKFPKVSLSASSSVFLLLR